MALAYLDDMIDLTNFLKKDLPFHPEPRLNIALIEPFVPKNKLSEFNDHIKSLLNKEVDIDTEFLGFMDDYYDIARMINRHTMNVKGHTYTVFDIGACHALQHLFFQNAVKYYAIDLIYDRIEYRPVFFTNNCEYITGRFSDVIEQLRTLVDKQSIGISNMSLIYTGTPVERALFDQLFERKFVF